MTGEQFTHILKFVEVGLIASVKFLLAPFEAERLGLSFYDSLVITTVGGFTGILVFAFAGTVISKWWRHVWATIRSCFSRKSATEIENKPRKKITATKKMIVRIKMRFGLAGIAFITPSVISVPLGVIAAFHLFRNKKKILIYMFISLLFWSVVLNYTAYYLGLSKYIP
ncbi:MAG: hypothetical protein Fur0041_20560 [Bacteroidia bacterium]